MSSVIVTGAGSALGGFAVRYLLDHTTHDVVAVASLRARQSAYMHPRLQWLAADLSAAPDAALTAALRRADRVLHFAWTRSGTQTEVQAANDAMIRGIIAALPVPTSFWLVSSVSGSPHARSTYGRTKHASSELALSLGANVLVCGLVVEPEPERGPYRMMRNVVWRLPFALRALGSVPFVYPIRLDDMGATLLGIVATPLPAGSYRMFSDPVSLNAFLALIERLRPRFRLPLPFSAGLAVRAASLGKRLHVFPEKLCDQVMTFLYKDEAHLRNHRPVPGLRLQACASPEFFAGPSGAS